jgi:predicted DNA-binding protein (MmcQ/YjbR family)
VELDTLGQLRALCLSLPETSETSSWGHPNFRAGKKTFAAFEQIRGRPSIAFRLNAVDIDLLRHRKAFFATPYGRGQWVSVWADTRLEWRLVADLLQRSYRLVALKRMLTALDARRHVGKALRRSSLSGRGEPSEREKKSGATKSRKIRQRQSHICTLLQSYTRSHAPARRLFSISLHARL